MLTIQAADLKFYTNPKLTHLLGCFKTMGTCYTLPCAVWTYIVVDADHIIGTEQERQEKCRLLRLHRCGNFARGAAAFIGKQLGIKCDLHPACNVRKLDDGQYAVPVDLKAPIPVPSSVTPWDRQCFSIFSWRLEMTAWQIQNILLDGDFAPAGWMRSWLQADTDAKFKTRIERAAGLSMAGILALPPAKKLVLDRSKIRAIRQAVTPDDLTRF